MGQFSKVAQDAFNNFSIDAGVLLKTFTPSTPKLNEGDIICATTGDISASCVPTYTDFGEDVNGCPANTKELKRLTGWETKLSFTALDMTPEVFKTALGAADIASGKITPRNKLNDADFSDLWLVCDRTDDGLVAVCIKNALSTSGLSLTTTKDGKGNLAVELTGHVSISDVDTVPMEFYAQAKGD